MNIEVEKISLAQMLLGVRSQSVLKQVREILLNSKEIVAYSTSGEPLTLEEYNQVIERAEEDIREGRTVTSDELTERMKTWRKK